jgi:hypothetical protein
MPDYIGRIAVPEVVAGGVLPLVPDYPHGRAQAPEVVVHPFGSANCKVEQRYLLGIGARRFTIRRSWLRDADRIALRNFGEAKYGPYGAFTYNAPTDDGTGTTAYTCRFANEPLSWEMVADWACSIGVTLIEIPTTSPSYPLYSTVTRFPSPALATALLAQADLPPAFERDFAGMYLGGWELLACGGSGPLSTASLLWQADAESHKDFFLTGIGSG